MSVVVVGFANDHAPSFYNLETNTPDEEIKKDRRDGYGSNRAPGLSVPRSVLEIFGSRVGTENLTIV